MAISHDNTTASIYLSSTHIETIRSKLGLDHVKLIQQNVEHFTENEGAMRDSIVESYFGKDGLEFLISLIVENLPLGNSLLDLGVGTGTFFYPITARTKALQSYGLDATPRMLELFAEKNTELKLDVDVILGDMEQISLSLEVNRKERDIQIPKKFSSIVSTLALHHIPDTEAVFREVSTLVEDDGTVIFVDSIDESDDSTPDPEHAHSGFKSAKLVELAKRYFTQVDLQILDLICGDSSCDSFGNQMFLLKMQK
ncbi:MAG: class I SAM-dependent methyltransferase [Candidatus Heimdallarchaeota archaeon]|nr:class I SAM-dependent methyltransferase [Candidatus Heimdallarchaeota archaeon]